ncbi:MAG: hypothetical protein HQK54_05640 [Oligoflexales bacterium]|nr:hypothetical protein [Oligoflexales bacterium]
MNDHENAFNVKNENELLKREVQELKETIEEMRKTINDREDAARDLESKMESLSKNPLDFVRSMESENSEPCLEIPLIRTPEKQAVLRKKVVQMDQVAGICRQVEVGVEGQVSNEIGTNMDEFLLDIKSYEPLNLVSENPCEIESGNSGGGNTLPDGLCEQLIEYDSKGRILLISKEEDIRLQMGTALAEMGYQTICALDFNKAVEIFSEAWKKDYPFITVIIDTASSSALLLRDQIKRILEMKADTKIIVPSGQGDGHLSENMVRSEHVRYIQKPYNFHEIAEIVRNIGPIPEKTDEPGTDKEKERDNLIMKCMADETERLTRYVRERQLYLREKKQKFRSFIFPKTCFSCGIKYQSVGSFINETIMVALSPCDDSEHKDGSGVIEYRQCSCSANLAFCAFNFRVTDQPGTQLREFFNECVTRIHKETKVNKKDIEVKVREIFRNEIQTCESRLTCS